MVKWRIQGPGIGIPFLMIWIGHIFRTPSFSWIGTLLKIIRPCGGVNITRTCILLLCYRQHSMEPHYDNPVTTTRFNTTKIVYSQYRSECFFYENVYEMKTSDILSHYFSHFTPHTLTYLIQLYLWMNILNATDTNTRIYKIWEKLREIEKKLIHMILIFSKLWHWTYLW